MNKLIFEKSVSGRRGYTLPTLSPAEAACVPNLPPQLCAAVPPELPEVSELDAIRHFTNLSRRNFSVDSHFYPLGSCTMKYNPRICEKVAALEGFAAAHPLLPQLPGGAALAQGALQVVYECEKLLAEICGMAAFTMQPMAGAHGELTGIMLIAAYHRARNNRRSTVLVPDSSHGTNPASAALAGYKVITVPSGADGCIDFDAFKAAINDDVAAVMMTCPNTLGLYETRIHEIAALAHQHDALLYYDGANLNAMLGRCRPGDLGFDVVHLNLHKTFATPHGGGGPGAGPVGVAASLAPYLPVSRVCRRDDGTYYLNDDYPATIGRIAPFYGNFGVYLKAYTYMRLLGSAGLREVAEQAVLNANYVKARLQPWYDLPYQRIVMHECVFSAARQAAKGVKALDIAKALIDKGFHPPTVYFPLIVKEALMIEPTETEARDELDRFIEAMIDIAKLAAENPTAFADMPHSTPVSRPDETRAARDMKFGI